jgi:hypothetical protein
MDIEIATTPNTALKETGFGGPAACECLRKPFKIRHRVKTMCVRQKQILAREEAHTQSKNLKYSKWV